MKGNCILIFHNLIDINFQDQNFLVVSDKFLKYNFVY